MSKCDLPHIALKTDSALRERRAHFAAQVGRTENPGDVRLKEMCPFTIYNVQKRSPSQILIPQTHSGEECGPVHIQQSFERSRKVFPEGLPAYVRGRGSDKNSRVRLTVQTRSAERNRIQSVYSGPETRMSTLPVPVQAPAPIVLPVRPSVPEGADTPIGSSLENQTAVQHRFLGLVGSATGKQLQQGDSSR